MDFKDSILQLSEKIGKQKDSILTEEAAKNAFIMPMLIALGYDVFNPDEVVPEVDCDLVKKKGEKIDYAVMKEGKPIFIIECKHCKQDLNLHDTQLQKYFVASQARFGVLTNGVEYRFYTDLDKTNLMDGKPFLVINMLDISDVDIEQLKKFHKSYYSEIEILSTAQELQISLQIKDILNRNFQSPGDEFTRYFVRCLNNGKSSAKLIEQYKPIIRKVVSGIINDTISERLSVAIKSGDSQMELNQFQQHASNNDGHEDGLATSDNDTGVVTTQDEIDAYNIVKSILRKDVDISRISFKDYKTYFVVYIDDSWKWVCRFYLNWKKYIAFPAPADGVRNEEKIEIQSLDDIFKLGDKLTDSLKNRL